MDQHPYTVYPREQPYLQQANQNQVARYRGIHNLFDTGKFAVVLKRDRHTYYFIINPQVGLLFSSMSPASMRQAVSETRSRRTMLFKNHPVCSLRQVNKQMSSQCLAMDACCHLSSATDLAVEKRLVR